MPILFLVNLRGTRIQNSCLFLLLHAFAVASRLYVDGLKVRALRKPSRFPLLLVVGPGVCTQARELLLQVSSLAVSYSVTVSKSSSTSQPHPVCGTGVSNNSISLD
ncbi:hypothetical protein CC78DRAFT_236772 [Lojkania enalia]|uniref:Uncharacterized protein n=1 Tax=Lojkania enalia TaxID=147567 RepID=A0A9P4NAI6_9PLEO|nr:hypothetical protein CC78DRAFT_236772 [Didymosphaeria enalia]